MAGIEEELRQIEDADAEWRRRFDGPWAVLRDAAGAAKPSAARVVDEAAANLRALVAEVLPTSERDE